MGDISDITKLAGFEFTKYVNYSDNGNIIALRAINVKNNKLNLDDIKYIDDSDFSKLKRSKLYFGDLLLTYIGANIGDVAIVPENDKFYLAPNICRIRHFDNINPIFLRNYFNTYLMIKEINKYINASSQPALLMCSIRKFKINCPKFEEQNKISDFLNNIDGKIELLQKKYNYYVKFKKYLMQNIFAQKLRFDFEDEWKKYLLGDISLIGKGFTPSTSNPSFWDGDLKWLSIADMNQGKYINQTTKTITYDGSKNKEPVKKGTLLMSFKLSIGKLGILTEDMYTNEAICNFQWKNKNVLTEYMYYYLGSINILKYGSQAAKGITLNNETLSTIPVLLPSLEEQKKIIDILSGVDLKINMLENSICDISKFKKGLLQQMFV